MSPTREEVARKIDPDAWAWYDRESRCIPEGAKATYRLPSDRQYVARFYDSLRRADTILALFAKPGASQGGGEITDEMVERGAKALRPHLKQRSIYQDEDIMARACLQAALSTPSTSEEG